MTYGTFTNLMATGYATTYLQTHGRGGAPVWRNNDGVIYQGGTVPITGNVPVLVGASITWESKPPYITQLIMPDTEGGEGVIFTISSVTVDNVITVTYAPEASPPGQQSSFRFEKSWSDGVLTTIVSGTLVSGGAGGEFTVDQSLTRPGSSATLSAIQVVGPTPPNGQFSAYFTVPFSLGNITIEFSDLRIVSDHLEVDYTYTGGPLTEFQSIRMSPGHHLYGSFHTFTGGAEIDHTMGTSGTLALTGGQIPGQSGLYEGDTNTDHYQIYVYRYDAADPGAGIHPDMVGPLSEGEYVFAFAPFTRSDSGFIIDPVTIPHTILFDWSDSGIS